MTRGGAKAERVTRSENMVVISQHILSNDYKLYFLAWDSLKSNVLGPEGPYP